jgi:hypothetical protein
MLSPCSKKIESTKKMFTNQQPKFLFGQLKKPSPLSSLSQKQNVDQENPFKVQDKIDEQA